MVKLRKLRCSFCRRDETEVAKLVAGPRVYICDQCVTIARSMMEGDNPEKPLEVRPTVWRRLTDRISRMFQNRKAVNVSG